MVILQIANHNVHQVLVDTESLVDVLFHSAYELIRLLLTIFKLVAPFFMVSLIIAYNLAKELSSSSQLAATLPRQLS